LSHFLFVSTWFFPSVLTHYATDTTRIYSVAALITHEPFFLGESSNPTVSTISVSVNSSGNDYQNMNSINHVCNRVLAHSKMFFQRLMLRKQMGLLQVEIDTQNELRRSVTPIQMIGIGLGNIIGE